MRGRSACYLRPFALHRGQLPDQRPEQLQPCSSKLYTGNGINLLQRPGRGRIAAPARLRARLTVDASTFKVFPTVASESPA